MTYEIWMESSFDCEKEYEREPPRYLGKFRAKNFFIASLMATEKHGFLNGFSVFADSPWINGYKFYHKDK